jgi:nucleotide-binding universal stress UspA family protein
MNTLHTAELGFRRALVPLDGSMVAATPLFEGLQVFTATRSGEAPQEIVAASRELKADVIAMTTHGRTGLKRLLFGSVAEAVLRTADTPVFMVRAAYLEAAMRVA